MDRRTFIKLTGSGVLVVAGGSVFTGCDRSAPELKVGPGFTGRRIATTGRVVPGTSHTWHTNPDGGGVFPAPDGGWVYVSNSESAAGGASMVRFSATGTVVAAKRILSGTVSNCAGGVTPWGTWLSCEERDVGRVYECDPFGARPAVVRPALGTFMHEAAAVDPVGRKIYLTEDRIDGGLYRFTPAAWRDLSAGVLEVLTDTRSVLAWVRVPWPGSTNPATRYQVAGTKRFNGGEGTCWTEGGVCFTTKGDSRVWRYVPTTNSLTVLYDRARSSNPILSGLDTITAGPGGDLFVAEDGGNMEIVRLRRDGTLQAVVQITGVTGSEVTGPAFSPDGTRLYFSSQRNPGATYEVRGPF